MSDIDFKVFMKIYKKCMAVPYFSLVKWVSNFDCKLFYRKTSSDKALIKQAKFELLINMFDSEIVGNALYDNNSYNLLEERKKVLNGIECGKIIIPNWTPDYRNFSDVISRIKDEIVQRDCGFDQ